MPKYATWLESNGTPKRNYREVEQHKPLSKEQVKESSVNEDRTFFNGFTSLMVSYILGIKTKVKIFSND